jgi:hypothetical protein
MSQKTPFFTVTAVKPSNLTFTGGNKLSGKGLKNDSNNYYIKGNKPNLLWLQHISRINGDNLKIYDTKPTSISEIKLV